MRRKKGCTKCTNVGWNFGLIFYTAQFGQMEGGTYMHIVVSGCQRIAE
ncbi:hypothetical protein [Bacteroides sp. MSB163]